MGHGAGSSPGPKGKGKEESSGWVPRGQELSTLLRRQLGLLAANAGVQEGLQVRHATN